MTVRVGAIHLGWDVLTVAAASADRPPRLVTVEGEKTTPAYILADASGNLHTGGRDRQRKDLGLAISDVREILGHEQIVVAGATWPADLVFRARLHNPLTAIGEYLGAPPQVLALPYPDSWSPTRVDEFAARAAASGVAVEPIPESVALSGYVRGAQIVTEDGPGVTVMHVDGRRVLVAAVHPDEMQPTESVEVQMPRDVASDPEVADNVVLESLSAARAMGAETGTIVLAGSAVDNEHLRLVFQNQLGQRLRVADHALHAVALGAVILVASEDDYVPSVPARGAAPVATAGAPGQPGPAVSGQPRPSGAQPAAPGQPGSPAPGQPLPAVAQAGAPGQVSGPGVPGQAGGPGVSESRRPGAPQHSAPQSQRPPVRPAMTGPQGQAPHAPRHAQRSVAEELTTKMSPPPTGEPATTRYPRPPLEDQRTTIMSRPGAQSPRPEQDHTYVPAQRQQPPSPRQQPPPQPQWEQMQVRPNNNARNIAIGAGVLVLIVILLLVFLL